MRLVLFCLTLIIVATQFVDTAYGSSARKPDFFRTINQGRKFDPYNPRIRPPYFAGGLQVGTHSDYTLEDPDLLYLRYYLDPKVRFHLDIPELDADRLSLGGEYLLGPLIGSKTWFGAELYPKNPDLGIYMRGVLQRSRAAKIHYKAYMTVIEEGLVFGAKGGYYNRPFRKSKNTYIDTLVGIQYLNTDSVSNTVFNLRGEIGHSWARFLDTNGLELYGSVGLEYGSINSEVDTGTDSISSSDSDIDIRIMIGILYHSPS